MSRMPSPNVNVPIALIAAIALKINSECRGFPTMRTLNVPIDRLTSRRSLNVPVFPSRFFLRQILVVKKVPDTFFFLFLPGFPGFPRGFSLIANKLQI